MRSEQRSQINFNKKYPPSEPCCCEICRSYCSRPGWWAVAEARRAYNHDLAKRMMLEISPDRTFGVLSPFFKGCEGRIATNNFSKNGCTFYTNSLCELYGSDYQPLECRFCHHDRVGLGIICHAELEKNWMTHDARLLVQQWCHKTGIWDILDVLGLGRLTKRI